MASSSKFTPLNTVYNDSMFSIAYGQWKENNIVTLRLAMRWTNTPTSKGFPNSRQRSSWLILPDNSDMILAFLKALVNLDTHSNNKEILSVIGTRIDS
jgi:hypothetical protein